MTARVTVVTPTMPRRAEKLRRAIRSVRAQTLREWQHLIVPDGPYFPGLDHLLREEGHHPDAERRTRVVPLGRPHRTPGHWNRTMAGLLCETALVAYLDDDNAYRPRHLELLVRALDENPEAGFAYGLCRYVDHVLGHDDISAVGALNHLDASMFVHRVELLSEVGNWDPLLYAGPGGNAYAVDGMMVDRWLARGVRYVRVPEITMDYFEIGYGLDGGGAR